MTLCFEWDPVKAASNEVKHGISFDAAREVFSDPLAITDQDRIEDGEYRWKTTGVALGFQLLVIAHVSRDQDDVEVIRIISARRADRVERRRYEQDG